MVVVRVELAGDVEGDDLADPGAEIVALTFSGMVRAYRSAIMK